MFYCNTYYRTSELFCWHNCWIKNPYCDELVFPCTNYFDQHHPLQDRGHMLPTLFRQPYPINYLLSSSTTVQCPFSPIFSFSPTAHLCSVSIICGMFVCLYKFLLLTLDFMMHLFLFVVLVGMYLYSAESKHLLSQQEAFPHSNSAWWLSFHFPLVSQEILFPKTLQILLQSLT